MIHLLLEDFFPPRNNSRELKGKIYVPQIIQLVYTDLRNIYF